MYVLPAREPAPVAERVGGQLGAVVAADEPGCGAALGDKEFQRGDGLVGVDAPVALDRQCFAGELVDDMQQLEDPAVGMPAAPRHRGETAASGPPGAGATGSPVSLRDLLQSGDLEHLIGTIRFSRAFSASSSLRRLTSSAFIPPYCARQR